MNAIGEAWLLNRAGNCIEVHAHPSESFEFESIVSLISEYGLESDKANCKTWRSTHSDASKTAILDSYHQNWCKVRLWKDNKLTFRIASKGFNWYSVIYGFLNRNPQVSSARITVSDGNGIIYWDDLTYDYCVEFSSNEALSTAFLKSYPNYEELIRIIQEVVDKAVDVLNYACCDGDSFKCENLFFVCEDFGLLVIDIRAEDYLTKALVGVGCLEDFYDPENHKPVIREIVNEALCAYAGIDKFDGDKIFDCVW